MSGAPLVGQRSEIFLHRCCSGAGDLPFANRTLVVIEEIEAPDLERAIVRAISRADAAVVSHDVQTILAVDGGVDRDKPFRTARSHSAGTSSVRARSRDLPAIAAVLVEWFSLA